MSKVKQIIDKAKAPRLNVNAAKRFVAGALWTPKETGELLLFPYTGVFIVTSTLQILF